MHRLLVALLAAFDALVAGAVGVAVVLVAVTGLWAFGGVTDWSSLWPTAAAVWQLGHLVPLAVHLPAQYVADAGIAKDAAAFTVSLAPLALTGLVAVLAARSGRRAGRSGRWWVGALSGTVVYAALATGVWATGRSAVAAVTAWHALAMPVVVYAVSVTAGALVAAWEDDDGVLGRLRDIVDDLPQRWRGTPALAVRGAVGVLVTLGGLGAVAVFIALVARSGQIVALYQTANLGGVGGAVVSLAQLAYLPTLIVWGVAFLAGPGFAVGTGTAVSPAGTDLGVLPGIPVLGALPTTTSPWLLAAALLPVGAGALAGWMLRAGTPALASADMTVRAALAVGVAVLSGGGAGGLAALASGGFGPARLARLGPAPGPVALAVGVEVLVGAAAFLLAPAGVPRRVPHPAPAAPDGAVARTVDGAATDRPFAPDDMPTEPVDGGFFGRRHRPGRRDDAPG